MALNVWTLLGQMNLDSSGFKRGLDDAIKTGDKAGASLEKNVGGAAKKTTTSLDQAAKAADGFVKELKERPIKGFSTATERMRKEVEAGLRPMKDLQNELKEQERALVATAKAQDKNSDEYRQTVEELTKVRRELASTTQAIETQRSAVDKLIDATSRIGRNMTLGVTGPILAAGTAAVAAAVKLGNYADKMLDLEQITGMSVTTLQEFENVARVAGVSTEVFNTAAAGLTRRLRATGEESKEFTENLRLIGVEARDLATGELKSVDDLLPEIIAGLQGVENASVRNSIAMQTLGRSGANLAPVLGLTADELQRAREEAHSMGQVMSREALQAANAFRIEWEQLRAEVGLAGRTIQEAAIPAVGDVVGMLRDHAVPVIKDAAEKVAALIEWWSGMPDVVKKSTVAILALSAAAGPAAIAVSALARAGMLLMGPAGWVALGITAVAGLALAFAGKTDSLDRAVNTAAAALTGDHDSLAASLDAVADNLKPEDPLRKRLKELQADLRGTGAAATEAAAETAEALAHLATAALRAELRTLQGQAARTQSLLASERDSGARRARIAQIEAEAEGYFARGENAPHTLMQELTQLQYAEAGSGLSPAEIARQESRLAATNARIIDLEREIAETVASFRETLAGGGASSTDGGGTTPPPTGLPAPKVVEEQGREIVGIIERLNADIAALTEKRKQTESKDELAALNREIEDKRAELAYWSAYTATQLSITPRATVGTPVALGDGAPSSRVLARTEREIAELRGSAARHAPSLVPLLTSAETLTESTAQSIEAALRIAQSLNATTAAGEKAAEERQRREQAFLESASELDRFKRTAASLAVTIAAANDAAERMDALERASARYSTGAIRGTDPVSMGPAGAAASRQAATAARAAREVVVAITEEYKRGNAGLDDVKAAVERLTTLVPTSVKDINLLTDNVIKLGAEADRAADAAARAAHFNETGATDLSIFTPIPAAPVSLTGAMDAVTAGDLGRSNLTAEQIQKILQEEMEARRALVDQLLTFSTEDGPLGMLGKSLANLVVDSIPLLGTAIDGFVQGGPMGALAAVFTELLSRTEAFSDIMAALDGILDPIVGALNTLLEALWPIIEVSINLFQAALQPLVIIIEKVLAPVITAVATLIAGLYNAIASAINWALGWLGVKLPMIELGPKAAQRGGVIEELEKEREQLLKDITAAKSEDEIARLNRELAAVDEELARLRALGRETDEPEPGKGANRERTAWQFSGTAQTIQFAVATPLVEAAQEMMSAALSIRETFSGGTEAGPMGAFTAALTNATPVLAALTEQGIRVNLNAPPKPQKPQTDNLGALR